MSLGQGKYVALKAMPVVGHFTPLCNGLRITGNFKFYNTPKITLLLFTSHGLAQPRTTRLPIPMSTGIAVAHGGCCRSRIAKRGECQVYQWKHQCLSASESEWSKRSCPTGHGEMSLVPASLVRP